MSTVMRPNLGEMTVSEIRQYCRDHEIKGHSRYTRRAQLVEFVESYLDELDSLLEMDLLDADRSATDGTEDQISPVAIASSQISPDLPRSTQINPDHPQVLALLGKTDQSESSLVIPELSQSHPKSIPGASPGHPSVIPRASCEYPQNILGLCTHHSTGITRSSPGHDPGIIDLYPKSSHGFSTIFPGSRIQQPLTQCSQVRGLSK